jgi:outer membrane protein assembly factor BamB
MRSRVRVIALAAASFAVLLGLVAGPAWTAGTAITLSPKSGPPTTQVTVTGAGFSATETVLVAFDSTQVASATTASTGSFSTSFIVPRSALPGNHTVKATGQTSTRSTTATFLVRTNWAKFHFGLTNSGDNPYENVIGPANVAKLNTAWTGATGGNNVSSPAVANGVVYIGSAGGNLYAFSAAGTTGCSGTPKTCSPLWAGTTGPSSSAPAVANGVVYVGSDDHKLYAFPAAGTTGCSGTPKTCQPLWTGATTNNIDSSPAVANGIVYIGSDDGKLYAFPAAGTTGCSGTPKTCKPLWTAASGNATSSPAVANGVVYVGSSADNKLHAFSAAGTTGCSGTPKTCNPLWTGTTTTGSIIGSSPAVANGVVYVGSSDGKLHAFH